MSMEERYCQSCGMPLNSDDQMGTNADGSTNWDYCKFCFQNGVFLQDCTMDKMIEHCSQFVDMVNQQMTQPITKDQYKEMMLGYFPMLKRWRK